MGSYRKVALTTASLVITCAALWFVCRQFEWNTFASQIRTLHWFWIAAAVAFDVSSYFAQGSRWSTLLDADVSVALTTRAVYTGLFLNEVLPMRPGELVRGWVVARHTGLPKGSILRSIVTERVIDTVILLAAALVVACVAPLPAGITRFVEVAAAVLSTAIAIGVYRLPRQWLAPVSNFSALAASSGILIGQCAAVWCTLRACGFPLSPVAGIVITLILRIGTAIPLSPANVGTHQVSMLAGLALYGITGPTATAGALVVFATLTLPLLLIGSAAFATHVGRELLPAAVQQ